VRGINNVTHIGVVAVGGEGAALCYRTICLQSAAFLGSHPHPEVSLHNFSLKEYQRLINLHDWRAELANLPGDYALPDGRLLIAQFQTETAGCVALRKFNNRTCEMKRKWSAPSFGATVWDLCSRKI
jgi:hypothetical protein